MSRPLAPRRMDARTLGLAIATAFSALSALAAVPLPASAQPTPTNAAPRLTRPPRVLQFVEAPYPEAEKAAGRAASVVLRIGISATGTVDLVEVVESAGPAFDAAAQEAVRRFLFEPAEIDGKPAAIRIHYRYDFVLRDEPPSPAPAPDPLPEPPAPDDDGPPPTPDGAPLDGPAPSGDVPDDLEIVVTAPVDRKQVVSSEISADEGRRVAGTQGDVLKIVENLPGVGRATVGTGQLVVWGAAPQDTRVYVDGVRVPLLYHHGGLRSVVHSDLVRSVELSPGGYGSPYGRGLGGLVSVQLRPLEDDGFHGAVAADLLDASAMVRASVDETWRFAVAARRSHLDALLPAFTSEDVGVLFPIPRYHDGQARVTHALSDRSSVELGGMLSGDFIDRTVQSADPSQRKRESRSVTWNRAYLRYRHDADDGAVVTVTPWGGTEQTSLTNHFGGTPASLTASTTVLGLRASYRGKPRPFLSTTVGLDAEAARTTLERAGSITAPPREGDIRVFGQPPSDQINVDTWSTVIASAAPFAEADLALFGDRVHVIPGLRFEPYVISGSRRTPREGDTPSIGHATADIVLEPRLAITADLSPRVRVKAAYGLYHQPPQPEDLSAVFGSPLLSTASAHHVLVGALYRLTTTLSTELTAFYSASSGLPARSPLPAPLLAEALVPDGRGRAYGVQILVRKEIASGFFGWITYSLMRSERQDRPASRVRLFDYDQTHVLTAVATYELGWGVELGARFRLASGMPRTPVVGATYDAQRDLYQPVFGPQNTERIPAFVQLDARAAKRFRFGSTELEIYLDVQNVTHRSNPEEIVYSYDYGEKGFITGLPILPSLGARFSW
ncbi:TonB-dependent receptor domain-containing protein [Chondromyces crocatus]|uniref:TonB C-terminal domain-containing protein n=1 Tax=Chondromyces crocatus TaxID=52 RepID=A0A0K1EHE9_CHOCO|nr:TonB-dependent receptor [Chondromyces crocatus]AKT40092.1 uncharacterized protein CMC5_042450 [Chondromyces crocatus]